MFDTRRSSDPYGEQPDPCHELGKGFITTQEKKRKRTSLPTWEAILLPPRTGRYINQHGVGNPEYVTDWQIAVTYTTRELYTGYRPKSALDKLPRFRKKLEQKEPIKNCGFTGIASAAAGTARACMAWNQVNPSSRSFCGESLETFYGIPVELVNTSVGGVNSDWALENAEERGNCVSAGSVYSGIRNERPVPRRRIPQKNTGSSGKAQGGMPLRRNTFSSPPLSPILWQKRRLNSSGAGSMSMGMRWGICAERGFVLADVQAVNRELLRKKRYEDIGANMINHPNDFFARIYAHVLDALLKP